MKTAPKIFIAEDDLFYAELLKSYLLANDLGLVEVYNSGEDLMKNIDKSPDIVILDYNLGTMLGIDVLKSIKKANPNTKVILISSYGSMKTAIACLRYGASDYIEKDDVGFKKIKHLINLISEGKPTSLRQTLFDYAS